jgi:exonuclease I
VDIYTYAASGYFLTDDSDSGTERFDLFIKNKGAFTSADFALLVDKVRFAIQQMTDYLPDPDSVFVEGFVLVSPRKNGFL